MSNSKTSAADYAPLIDAMKFYIEPEISCSRFFGAACFTEESLNNYRSVAGIDSIGLLRLSELGEYVARHLKNGLFIDIPCGLHVPADPAHDFAMAPLVAALGATHLWEIDKTADVLRDRIHDAGGSLAIVTMQDDLLGFIAKLSAETTPAPKAFYLSAIQPDAEFCAHMENQRDIAVPYLAALYDELARVCQKDDLVILNSGNMLVAGIDETIFPMIHPAIALPARGFSLMRRCAYDKVQVYKKD